MLANLQRMADYTARHGIALRPHAKTHKSLDVARLQLAYGAIGLTAAKVSEAEVLAQVCDDLLLAYPVVDEPRAHRAAVLAGRVDLKVAVDSLDSAKLLSDAARDAGVSIGILVDLDVGLHRTGLQSPQAATELATAVDRLPNLSLRGLFCYPGQIWDPADEQGPALHEVAERLQETISLWQRRGLAAEIVSGGSTPTAFQSHRVPQITEIRPGTYPFNDMNTALGGYCGLDDCAARIVVSVVSDAVPGQVVIDAGSKTLAADRCVPDPENGHGHVVEFPAARITKLSEEHGQIDFSEYEKRPQVGERLTIIPNHICPCINLQHTVWLATSDGQVKAMTVDARGMLT